MDPSSGSRRLLLLLVVSSLCLLAFVADAAHVVHLGLQSMEPPAVGRRHRTGYHFQPRSHWINDPNGPMYYKGYYHLFYQYNPKGAVWGNIVWAHSFSTDLVNWIRLPLAIYPTDNFDINGCWSGSATILPDGRPAILYTGIDADKRQVQNVAFPADLSDPLLLHWRKPSYNPVIFPTPPINASAFRDPTTAWLGSDGVWRVAVGSRRQRRGLAVLYRSRDFTTWVRAKHPLHSAAGTGMWECPDFFPVLAGGGRQGVDTSAGYGLGFRHVLKVSLELTRFDYYTIGTYDVASDRYRPDPNLNDDHTGLRYDYGNFYASKTFYDPVKHRRILWGWANESDSVSSDIQKGWSGIQAIPREIWLDESGKQLLQWPVEEIEKLRRKPVKYWAVMLPGGGSVYPVKDFRTSRGDVEVTFVIKNLEHAEPFDQSWKADPQKLCGMKRADMMGGVGPFGIQVLATADRNERTSVYFIVFKGLQKHIVLSCHDPSSSTYMSGVYKPSFGGFVEMAIAKDKRISLRTLIDNSVVESFADGGRTCITSRVYPTMGLGRNSHLFVFNNGKSDVEVEELTAWRMAKPVSMN